MRVCVCVCVCVVCVVCACVSVCVHVQSIRGLRNLLEKLEGESKEFESIDTACALHELGVLNAMFGDLE